MGSAGSGRAGRIALYLLVLNLLALAGGLGMQYVAANRMPDVREINPEKIKLWTQPEPYKPASAAAPAEEQLDPVVAAAVADEAKAAPDGKTPEAAPAVKAPEVAPPAKTPEAVPPAKTAEAAASSPAGNRVCMVLDDLTQARYEAVRGALAAGGFNENSCLLYFPKPLAWWVYWPPEYEAARRDKVIEQLHAAGVKDVLPITQGVMAQAFSVGVLSSESQARLYRDQLRSKGLDKIEYGLRPSVTQGKLSCNLADAEQVKKLRAALPAWVKTGTPGDCAP